MQRTPHRKPQKSAVLASPFSRGFLNAAFRHRCAGRLAGVISAGRFAIVGKPGLVGPDLALDLLHVPGRIEIALSHIPRDDGNRYPRDVHAIIREIPVDQCDASARPITRRC